MYITIGVGIALILAVFLPDMIVKKKKQDEENETPDIQTEIDKTTQENERLREEVEKLRAQMTANDSKNAK
jgi:cell division protein FtsL